MPTQPTPGAVWIQALASARQAQTETNSSGARRSGLASLPLNQAPRATALPRLRRTAAQIDPTLQEAIRLLVGAEAPWPLFLHGEVGVGKTCAALCLLDLAGGEYHTVSGLCQLLNRAQQGQLEWYSEGHGGKLWPEQIWARLARTPLLVLDEIGTRAQVTDAHYEAVRQCVDERYNLPLVVISNLPVAALARLYDDRLVSRLGAGTIVELSGPDRRLQ